MQKLIEHSVQNGLVLAIPDQPTTRESLGCLTALFVVTFLPLVGYVVFTLWSDGHMDGGVIVFSGVIALVGIVLLVRRAPVRMEILSDQNRWTTTVASTQSIWPSSRSISLSDIHRIEVERQHWSKAGDTEKPSGEPRAVFSMSLFDSDGERLSDWWMDIDGIGDSRQIMDFLLRVAKATGLASYHVNRSDSRQLEAVAYRKPDPDLEPVVSVTSSPNDTEAIAETAPTVIPPFEPESIPRWLDFDALEWQPGTQVQLGKLLRFRSFPPMFLATAALAISLLILSSPTLLDLLGLTYMTDLVLFAVILSGILLFFVILHFLFFAYPRWRSWRWLIDWPSARILVTRGGRRREIRFDQLTGLGLRGCWSKITTTKTLGRASGGEYRSQSVSYLYSFDVVLFVKSLSREDSVLALQTRSSYFDDASTQGYQCMLSLVADLSAALDVPYRFEDFRDHSDYPKYDWQ